MDQKILLQLSHLARSTIQRFLSNKELSSTMVYVRAHDQTVAQDYFAAMERVEQRLEIVPKKKDEDIGDVKVQVVQLIEQLEVPELCLKERLDNARQLRQYWTRLLPL